jgi:hypothetical protein
MDMHNESNYRCWSHSNRAKGRAPAMGPNHRRELETLNTSCGNDVQAGFTNPLTRGCGRLFPANTCLAALRRGRAVPALVLESVLQRRWDRQRGNSTLLRLLNRLCARTLPLLLCAALAGPASHALAQTIVTNILVPTPSFGPVLDPGLNHIYLWTGTQGYETVLAIDGTTFQQTNWGVGQGVDVDLGNHNVWAASLYSGFALVRAGSHGTPDGFASLGFCPGSVAVDASNRVAWVEAQCGVGSDPVWAVNADDFSVLAGPIRCGGVNGGPAAVNPATGRFYLPSGGVPERLDSATFTLTTTAFGPVIGVNPSANLLYAQGPGGVLQIINGAPDPEVVLTNVALPFLVPATPLGVDPLRNRIYIPNPATNRIWMLDGATGQSLGTMNLDAKATSVQGVAVDASRNLVYALAVAGDGSYHLYSIQGAGSAPQPWLFNPVRSGTSFSFSVLTWAGSTDVLEYTTSLANPQWQPLSSVFGDGAVRILTDSSATNSQRFYRVERQGGN